MGHVKKVLYINIKSKDFVHCTTTKERLIKEINLSNKARKKGGKSKNIIEV